MAARAVAELVGVRNHFAGIHLGTVPSWRQATKRTGADGKRPGPKRCGRRMRLRSRSFRTTSLRGFSLERFQGGLWQLSA